MRFADIEVGQQLDVTFGNVFNPVLTVKKVAFATDGTVRFEASSTGNNVKVRMEGFWRDEVGA